MGDALPAVAILVLAVFVVLIQTHFAALQRRLDRLSRVEGKLDAILKHLGLQFDPFGEIPPEVLAAVREGRKIEAIKQYRQATGAGLAEAKEIIEEALRGIAAGTERT